VALDKSGVDSVRELSVGEVRGDVILNLVGLKAGCKYT
jgi:hypothetical protein